MNYSNIKILRETVKKIDRHFCLNAYPTSGATKHHVILLGKLSTFPSTRNKQTNKKTENKTITVKPLVVRNNSLTLKINKQLWFFDI